jgi:hypothetical protein
LKSGLKGKLSHAKNNLTSRRSSSFLLWVDCLLRNSSPPHESNLESIDITGFSASAVLDALSEPRTATVTYLDGSNSVLTITLNYTDGAIQLVERADTQFEPDWYPEEPCLSHIDIEATLILSSDDGAIDFTEPVNLKAYQVDYITTAREVLSGALTGLLEASSLNPSENDRIRYYLDTAWLQDNVTGSLTANIEPGALSADESSPESIVSISMNSLASW